MFYFVYLCHVSCFVCPERTVPARTDKYMKYKYMKYKYKDNWASSLANSVDQNCERAFQTSYSIRLSARYMKHRNLRLSVETKQGRKTSGASKICSIFCIKYIDLSVVLTYRQEKKDVLGFNFA